MKDMKILHSMVHLDFWYSSLYLIKNNFVNQCSKYRQAISRIFSMKWLIYKIIYLLNIRMNIKNLNEPYLECRIFISFIWYQSELWNQINTCSRFCQQYCFGNSKTSSMFYFMNFFGKNREVGQQINVRSTKLKCHSKGIKENDALSQVLH